MVLKVVTDVDSSEVFGACYISMVVLNCESEISYILADLFNMFLQESCFPGYW